jgi:SSS family solute:Na+ symporter
VELLGVLVIVALTLGTGAIAGRKVKNSSDYTVAGRRNGAATVAGVIIGALLGGSSTIGTAQAAYQYGMTAWWFTLGAGIGCLVLGRLLAKALRAADVETIPHFLRRSYGPAMRPGIAVADSIGIFLTIPAQITSAIALLAVILPLNATWATLTVAVLVALFCLTGGAISAGAAGLVKLVFIYLALLAIGIVAIVLGGGPAELLSGLPSDFLGLVGHDGGPGITDGVATMVGVWCTQIYVLSVFSARSVGQARRGAYFAGFGMIIFGLGGVAAGLYMRKYHPGIRAVQALPLFVKENFGGLASGLILGALLITVIACASALALGISTMATRDLYQNFRKSNLSDSSLVWFARAVMVVVIALAVLVVKSNVIQLVVTYSFLAFALRAATIAVPLLAVIAFPRSRYISPAGGLAAAIAGLATDIVLSILQVPYTLYWSFAASIVGLLVGGRLRPRSSRNDLAALRGGDRVEADPREASA